MVYVISKEGKPLMPTKRYGKVRRLLNNNQAKVVRRKPFTIQLLFGTTNYTQSVYVGVDSGYEKVGVSAITQTEEVFSAEVNLLKGVSERLKERRMYRNHRRNRKRYRKPRFDNRKRKEGWLAPSIQHKLNSHIKIVKMIKNIIPITKVIVEVANFDIQKIKNLEIEGEQYQKGEQYGFENTRNYVLHRDNHKCKNPKCKNKLKNKILEVHHIGFWRGDRSDRPSNLITLCTKCHTPKNHKENGDLYGWKPKLDSFKPETFMATVRWRIVNELNCDYTFGYITKSKRIALGLEKNHVTDAFVIAGGGSQERIESYTINQYRRNNRSLEKFYDAVYKDVRDGKRRKGQELYSGRRSRNKNYNEENFREYRAEKVKKGRRSIRKRKYKLSPKDLVKLGGMICEVGGVQNQGSYVKLKEIKKPVKVEKVRVIKYQRGLSVA